MSRPSGHPNRFWGSKALRPALTTDAERGDLKVTAGWGHAGQGRIVERGYTPEELSVLEQGARELGLSLAELLQQLGDSTRDVYLNEVTCWRNVIAAMLLLGRQLDANYRTVKENCYPWPARAGVGWQD